MPKYAHFNAAANPAPVIAWFDTDSGEWPNLPGNDYLVEATPAQWAARSSQKWQVRDRTLEPAPGITLTQAQKSRLALIEADYGQVVQAPVSYMGTTFQADDGSQAILAKTLLILTPQGATPQGFYWLDANNVAVTMTLSQLQGLAYAMFQQGWPAFQNKKNKKDAIRAASTVASVQSITW